MLNFQLFRKNDSGITASNIFNSSSKNKSAEQLQQQIDNVTSSIRLNICCFSPLRFFLYGKIEGASRWDHLLFSIVSRFKYCYFLLLYYYHRWACSSSPTRTVIQGTGPGLSRSLDIAYFLNSEIFWLLSKLMNLNFEVLGISCFSAFSPMINYCEHKINYTTEKFCSYLNFILKYALFSKEILDLLPKFMSHNLYIHSFNS